uniref:ribosomal protein L22 n=1 Tax=Streptofilum capillatum TaxID=2058781 RepID=UPI00286C28DC|nr:ribosomal protein L22 [Streptofilum capillatum]WKT08564.1 ribosomal protein L22 [Streptofilum capillatum]WKT08663.1 ribosomal protein L22 [Streptofilum sp. BC4-VF8pt]WKT08762.1 ribosomal protein L22 [Streptofilum sp. ZNP2-VF4pt]
MSVESTNVQARAAARSVPISPIKVGRVVDQIRGRSYQEALMMLEFMPYKACRPVLQVLYSAAANAEHNLGISKSNLEISEATANQGPVMKRFQPRAQGRGYPIRKPTCHITIAVRAKK